MQPPKPAPVSRAPYAPCSTRELDEQVELGRRHREVVAQRRVALRASARRTVARSPARSASTNASDPCVLGHDVARDRVVGDLRRASRRASVGTPRRAAAASHAARRCAYALAARRRGEPAVHDDDGDRRRAAGPASIVERAAVEQQRVTRPPEHRRHLVHDAARHAGRGCSASCASEREVAARRAATSATCGSRERDRDLERRARREARADRHRRRDRGVEADADAAAPRAPRARRDRAAQRADDARFAAPSAGGRRAFESIEPITTRPSARGANATRRRGRSPSAGRGRPGSRCGRRSG